MFPTDNSANSYQNPASVPVYFYNQPQAPTADYYPSHPVPPSGQNIFAGHSVASYQPQPAVGMPVHFYNQPQAPTEDYYPPQTLPVEQEPFADNSVVPHYYNSHQPLPDLVTTHPQHFYIQDQHRFHSASRQTATNDDELSLEVSRAYSLLKKFPVQAEKAFRKIYVSSLKNVNESVVTGLARAIKDQKDSHRYKEAEEIILSFKGSTIDPAITSGYHNLDNTLARLWQVMGKNEQAEKLLLAMAGKHLGMADEMLCNPSGKHDIDLALVRLWEVMGKNEQAEKLCSFTGIKHSRPDIS